MRVLRHEFAMVYLMNSAASLAFLCLRQDLSPTCSETLISCDTYLELDTVITLLITFECAFLTIKYHGLMALIYQFIF